MRSLRVEEQREMMRRVAWVLVIVLAATWGIQAQTAPAQARRDQIHETYDLAAGGTVSVTNISGYIRITSWDENRVKVDAVKRGGPSENDQVDVQVSASAAVVVVRVVTDRTNPSRLRDYGVVVDIDLKVPRTALLTPIVTISGEIRVTGPVAQLTARSTSGQIEAHDIKGPASLTTASGALLASGIGSANSQNVVSTMSGRIVLDRVTGRTSARSIAGAVTVTDSDGDVGADSTGGLVVVERVRGRVNASSQGGKVVVRNVQEGANARAVGGSVEITEAKGRIVATTISGSIALSGVDSRDVTARSSNGSVAFVGRINPDGRYSFESFSGSISLLIPAESQFNLTATSHNGGINTEFPIRVEGGLGNDRQLRGTAGQGGAEIIATGFNGRIEIKKQK